MKLVLIIESPAGTAQRTQTIEGAYCIIGRSKVHVTLDDPRCSSQHSVLFQGLDGKLYVRDLDSTNGTFVKGTKIDEAELDVGSRFNIGRSAIAVVQFRPVLPPRPATLANHSAEEGSEDRTVITTREESRAAAGGEVIHTWPANHYAQPPAKQGAFISFVDQEGTQTHLQIDKLKKL